jgi:hypothetical protein
VKLVFAQECATRDEAFAAEQQIKGWSRKKKEAMIEGDWVEVNRLARGKHKHQLRLTAIDYPSTSALRAYAQDERWYSSRMKNPCAF